MLKTVSWRDFLGQSKGPKSLSPSTVPTVVYELPGCTGCSSQPACGLDSLPDLLKPQEQRSVQPEQSKSPSLSTCVAVASVRFLIQLHASEHVHDEYMMVGAGSGD